MQILHHRCTGWYNWAVNIQSWFMACMKMLSRTLLILKIRDPRESAWASDTKTVEVDGVLIGTVTFRNMVKRLWHSFKHCGIQLTFDDHDACALVEYVGTWLRKSMQSLTVSAWRVYWNSMCMIQDERLLCIKPLLSNERTFKSSVHQSLDYTHIFVTIIKTANEKIYFGKMVSSLW